MAIKEIISEIRKTAKDLFPPKRNDEWPKRGQGRIISPRGATTTRTNTGKSLAEHILEDGSSN